jgi:hypothetical protein
MLFGVKMMHRSRLTLPFLLLILYIGMGDLLPGPLGKFSLQTRGKIDQWIVGLVPQWRPKVNPYHRTEDQLQKAEKGS